MAVQHRVAPISNRVSRGACSGDVKQLIWAILGTKEDKHKEGFIFASTRTAIYSTVIVGGGPNPRR
jgi:hypothetical protein